MQFCSRPSLILLSLIAIAWLAASFSALNVTHWSFTACGLGFLALSAIPQAWEKNAELRLHFIAAALPVAFLWAFHHQALNGWWLYDDLFVLWRAEQAPLWDYFFDGPTWRSFSNAGFAPWSLLSNGADLHLLGLNAAAHFWHHLLSFSLLLLAGYAVFSRFLPPLFASLALILFLLSASSAALAQYLMLRHYLEGMLLMLLGFWGYLYAQDKQRIGWAYLGALCYFGATLAKEIYVPLVVALAMLPLWSPQPRQWWSQFRQRLPYLLPYIIAATVYVLWRWLMLGGNLVSGYGAIYRPTEWADILAYLQTFMQLLQASWIYQGLVLSALLGLLLSAWRQPWTWTPSALLWVLLVWAPVISIIPILMTRHILLQVLLLSYGLALGLSAWQSLWSRQYGLWAALALALIFFSADNMQRDPVWSDREILQRYRVEGEFLLHSDASDTLLLDTLGVPQHAWSLLGLRKDFLQQPYGPQAFYDPCVSAAAPQRAVRFIDGELQGEQPLPDTTCHNEQTRPLSLDIELNQQSFRWQMGPYQQGTYAILVLDAEQDFIIATPLTPVPMAAFNYAPMRPLRFVLRYQSPEGWITHSPVLFFNPQGLGEQASVSLHYQRP